MKYHRDRDVGFERTRMLKAKENSFNNVQNHFLAPDRGRPPLGVRFGLLSLLPLLPALVFLVFPFESAESALFCVSSPSAAFARSRSSRMSRKCDRRGEGHPGVAPAGSVVPEGLVTVTAPISFISAATCSSRFSFATRSPRTGAPIFMNGAWIPIACIHNYLLL